jgi:TolA-binding protein
MNIQLFRGIRMMVLFSMRDSSRDSNSREALKMTGLRRKGALSGWTFCLGLLVLGILAGRAFPAPGVVDPNEPRQKNEQRELSERLEELIRRLRQERSAYYVQKARQEARIEKARENHKVLQEELDELRRQEAEADQQLRKYEAEVEDLKEQLAPRTTLENILAGQIKPFLTSQRAAIEKGIPYKQPERIARLEAARGDPNAPSRIPAADQLGHIWNYAQEELRLARSSETYTARAKSKDESSPYARFFRVGQRILGYMTEDGRLAAIWSSLQDDKDWMFVTDMKQSSQVRDAVEILDRRQGPKLVTLPIPLQSEDSDKGGQ